MTLAERISLRAQQGGVPVSSSLAAGLDSYLCLLAKWNTTINLTSLNLEPVDDQALDRLLIEPLVAARLVPAASRLAIDIGSGGGSPAVPMKLALPAVRFVLVESKVRKASFLREVVRHLALDAVEVANCRFEALLTRPDLSGAADLVTLRAVKADHRLWAGIQAVLRPGGKVILFTGPGQPVLGSILSPFQVEASQTVPFSGTQLTIVRCMA